MRADGLFVKIGYSKHPEKRRTQLQTASPEALEIVCKVPGDRKIEKALHRIFAPLKVIFGGSEWFALSPGLKLYIKRLQELGRYEPPNMIESLCLPLKSDFLR